MGGQSPPKSLIIFMYGLAPGQSLLRCQMMYGQRKIGSRKTLLWAEHVVSNTIWKWRYGFLDKDTVDSEAMAELERLSQFKQWWARLYVASIMRYYPTFRNQEIIDRLAKDENEMVKRVIKTVTESQKKEKAEDTKSDKSKKPEVSQPDPQKSEDKE